MTVVNTFTIYAYAPLNITPSGWGKCPRLRSGLTSLLYSCGTGLAREVPDRRTAPGNEKQGGSAMILFLQCYFGISAQCLGFKV